MADSHGQAQQIADALLFLKANGCKAIYHLGDICDSAHPETADPCVTLLRQNRVMGIKGNNDHLVVVNHQGQQQDRVTPETIEFLSHLPMTLTLGDMILAHSLPFVEERGLSSMVGALGQAEAKLFFQTYPKKLLIRGHSHLPEILFWQNQSVVNRRISTDKPLLIEDVKPAIITCGALDQGFVMVWDRAGKMIESHTCF